MLLSLVDSLRCPREHESSSLVLSAETWFGQRIERGVLGCPVCDARFPIAAGIVDFSNGADSSEPPRESGNASAALRLAAQLGLSEPGGIILLAGGYGTLVDPLLEIVEFTPILLGSVSDSAVTFRLLNRLPLADDVLRAAAVDQARTTPSLLAELSRTIRPGGRLVAPVATSLPEGLRSLASDEREWVAESQATMPVIPLRRGTS